MSKEKKEEFGKKSTKAIKIAGFGLLAIVAIGVGLTFFGDNINELFDMSKSEFSKTLRDLPSKLMESNYDKNLNFLLDADCNDLETWIAEAEKEQARTFTHYEFEKVEGQSEYESTSTSFTIDKELLPRAELIQKNKCEIYAFEYQNDFYDENREILASDLKLTFYDMGMNEIIPEYWYSNCLDMDCEKTEPDTSRDTVIVPIEDHIVYFTINHNMTNVFIDPNAIVEKNSEVLGFDWKVVDKFGQYVFEMNSETLRDYYQTHTEMLPMTYLYLSGFEDKPVYVAPRDTSIVIDKILEDVEETELTEEQLELDLPTNTRDMTKFISNNELSDEEAIILMQYAVAFERGLEPDEKINSEARKIFERLN